MKKILLISFVLITSFAFGQVNDKPKYGKYNFGDSTFTIDDPYNATSWNGNFSIPTKNAIRDKIEALGGGGYTLLSQFVGETNWTTGYINGSGDYTALALGSSGKVLTSNGASSAPTWETPVAGNIYTIDGTVTGGNRTITMGSNNVSFSSASGSSFLASSSSGGTTGQLTVNTSNSYLIGTSGTYEASVFVQAFTTGMYSQRDGRISRIDFRPDSIFFRPGGEGKMNIDSLRVVYDTTANKPMTWNTTTGEWSYNAYWPSGGGSGETNTASNLGGGLDNYSTKVGVDLRFNTFAAADFDLASNLITIDATKWLTISAAAAAYEPLGTAYTNVTQFVAQNNWKVFYSNGSGDITELAIGASGTALTSNGTTSAPSFQIPTALWAGVFNSTSETISTPVSISTSPVVINTDAGAVVYNLPTIAASTNQSYFIKNAGASNLTVQRTSTDNIWTTAAVTSEVLQPGESRVYIRGTAYWYSYGSTQAAYQPLDADLTSWAAITRASGIDTWIATPSSANLRSALTDENGTGAALFNGATTPDFTTGFTIGGAASSGKIMKANGTNFVPSTETYAAPGTSGNIMTSDGTNWTAATNKGGWTELKVAGSNYTNATTSLTDVTGLVSATLATATLYEFEADLYVNSSSTAGMQIAVQQTGTGSGQIGVWSGTATNAAATGMAIGSNALNTAGAACVLVNGDGHIVIKGFIKTGSSGSPTILIRALKTTSGTATIYIGSVMRFRAA